MLVAGGEVNITTYFALRLTADGTAATGLTITNFDLQYVRSGVAPVAKVDATALAATDSAHADNKAIEIDATDQPGLYRVDWPDAAFAAGVQEVILSVKVATAFTEHLRVEIDGQVNIWKINNSTSAAQVLAAWMGQGTSAVADSGTTTTLVDAGLSQANTRWRGALLVFTSGTNSGQTRPVTNFDPATDTLTFTPALPDAVTTESYALIPGLAWADVQAWLSTAVGAATAGVPNVNATEISGDSTAADNLELQYDTTGLTGDTFPATQAQVGNIGSVSGGSLPFEVNTDNSITDTIDAAAAVDKGSGLVGIPVTGHAFAAPFEVTIASTINYNGSFKIISATANEVVITASFVSETFGGSETIISTIKGIASVGTEAGTFSNTESLDGNRHVLTNVGDNIDWIYRISVGGGRTASFVDFHGYLTGNNDTINIQAYDFVGSDWETRAVLQGTSQTTDQTLAVSLLSKHTGTSGDDLGLAFIRFVDATAAGHVLGIDELLVQAVGKGETAGYALGQIWYNSNNGTSGTVPFVNGIVERPSLLWADAQTISANARVNITDFHIINGSLVTLDAASQNFSLFGDNWTLDLNGQDVDEAYFQGCHVSGVGISATEVHYEGAEVTTMSVQNGHFDFCSFDGTVTHTLAGDNNYHNCYSKVAGAGGPTFTKTAGQVITVQFRNWAGSMTVSGIQASDVMTISGTELGAIVLNGADGTVKILGIYESLTDNRTGSPTLIEGAFEGSDVTDILVDTGEIGTAGAGLTDLGGMSTGMKSEIGDAVMDEALSGHQTQGTAGAAITMTAYLGPQGPGVYLDDGAANTGTTLGDDGTREKPVSTIAAATTIASGLGVQLIYLVNDTVTTLAQTYEGWVFVGLGLSNKITLGSQDVDNSEFCNLILTGTQGGTGQLYAHHCSLTALVSAELIAFCCWWSGDIALRAYDNHLFKDCCSSEPGDVRPTLTFPGSGVTKVSIRGHSGGIELVNGIAADVITTEFVAGQLVIAASCNDMTVRPRGVLKFTNNGTNINIELEAAINRTNINAEADTALADYDGPTNAEMEARTLAAGPLAQLSQNLDDCFTGTASGTPTTTTMVSDIGVTVDDQYNGRIITFDDDTTTAAVRGQSTDITGCTAASNTLTFTALTTAPVSGDTFIIT